MSAAEREAERRFPLWPPTGDYEIDREDYSELGAKWQNEDAERDRAHFVQGAEWQAERDAERIAELETEVERQTAYAKNATDQQGHLLRQHREARARAEVAEAKLAAVRALHQRSTVLTNLDDTPYCRHCIAPWPCATIQAIEGDQT